MSNKRCFLIAKIKIDTNLSFKEIENLVNDIPEKYLSEAIILYKDYGYDFLKECTSGIIR